MGMVYGATKFTEASRYHVHSTVIFPDFIYLCISGYKINKIIQQSTKLVSTESYTRIMDLKILSEPSYGLNMFHINYQALFLPDKLIMHLTLHELEY